MNNDFVFASKIVELSEEKDYLTLKNRVFFFNSPNLNHVQIDYDESSLEQCKSLINCPLLAKYVKRNGQDDLGGHEVSMNNGQVEFNTAAIGTITDVEIVEEDVETVDGKIQKLPCLYATEVVWTRFKNATNAIQRLYKSGKLHNSWELKSSDYSFSNGVKYIKGYKFIGNCLLGTESFPAYGRSARILDISENTDQYEYLAAESFSEALALDLESESASNIISNQLSDINRKEELSMDVNENVVVETSEEEVKEDTTEVVETEEVVEAEVKESEDNEVAEVSEDNPVEESTTDKTEEVESAETEDAEGETEEVSAMKTVRDISRMIRVALNEINDEDYMDVAMIFPEEKIVLVQSWRMKELEFIQYSYRVEGEKVVLEDKKEVEMTISPLQINSEIESKNNIIAEANSRIVELENQNAELVKAKEELDKIKAEQAETEHSEAVNKLREYVVKSGRFTEEEIASEEVQKAINELNETWLKSEIADRLVASLAEQKSKKTEVSEVKETKSTLSVVLSENEKSATPDDILRVFFNRKD